MIRWCIIGAGGIADRRTIPALLQDKESKLVAVMDKNADVAKIIGEKYNVPYYSNEKQMLDNEKCEAVYIATPVFCHKEQAELALSYGCHTFIEKPICFTAKESEELLNKFKAKNKQLTIGYMMKYHNLHVKAKELIDNGDIGDISSIRAQFTCWYPEIPGAWRQNKKLSGGGAIMDLGVHCIELINYLLDDEMVEVKGIYSTRTFTYEVEDGAVIIFKTKKGVIGHIDVNFNIPDAASNSKLEIYGTKGYVIANGTLAQEEVGVLNHLYVNQGAYEAAQTRVEYKPTEYKAEGGNIYLKQLLHFREIVESGTPDYSYTELAVNVQEVVDKIYNQ